MPCIGLSSPCLAKQCMCLPLMLGGYVQRPEETMLLHNLVIIQLMAEELTQVQFHEAAAIVDKAGRNASGELDAVSCEGVERAACQLAEASLQRGQWGH